MGTCKRLKNVVYLYTRLCEVSLKRRYFAFFCLFIVILQGQTLCKKVKTIFDFPQGLFEKVKGL